MLKEKFNRLINHNSDDLTRKRAKLQDALNRDSPLPLKNLGNTCYENSIIQCLFGLDMFMSNFEESMEDIRRLVVRPSLENDIQNGADKTLNLFSTTSNRNTKTITEDDVRFRIADAFDNLFKSYTQRRIQSAYNDQNGSKTYLLQPDVKLIEGPSEEDASNETELSAIPLRKSDRLDPPGSPTFSTDNQTSHSNLNTPSNLTPIALVSSSSTSREQSLIERRLEELKTAVGERSHQFNSGNQQDASEFFYHVIDSIQEFYQSLDRSTDDNNPVTKAFELVLEQSVECPKCSHRETLEIGKVRTLHLALPQSDVDNPDQNPFHPESNEAPTPPNSDLGIDSPRHDTLEEHRDGSEEKENRAFIDDDDYNSYKKEVEIENVPHMNSVEKFDAEVSSCLTRYTLCDALKNYFKEDVLDYNCLQAGCDSKQRLKKCLIKKLPQVLFITLARYSYSGKKNLDEIEAPLELKVPTGECKPSSDSPSAEAQQELNGLDTEYQLVAAVCHLGSSLYAGHYTSYVYNQNNSSWYSCDDDSIKKVQESVVKHDTNKNGYCFFYAQKSCLISKDQTKTGQPKTINVSKATQESTISNIVLNSTVVMTPESSPQSSPSPINKSNETTNMHDEKSHACCVNNQYVDDWS